MNLTLELVSQTIDIDISQFTIIFNNLEKYLNLENGFHLIC